MLTELAADLAKVDTQAEELAKGSTEAAAQLDKLGTEAKEASTGVTETGQAAQQAGVELKELSDAVNQKTAAIKAGLDAERSEIEIQQQMLAASRAEQQARLDGRVSAVM